MRFVPAALLLCGLAASSFAQAPRPAPEFQVEMPGGKQLAVKSLRGKIVVLAFISTTCPHCQQMTQELNQIQQQYAAKGVQVVASAFNEPINEKVIGDFVDQYKPAFPMGWNTRVAVYAFAGHSILSQKPFYVPHLTFIDRKGVIQAEVNGEDPFMHKAGENIRAQLDKMLAAAPSAKKTASPRK